MRLVPRRYTLFKHWVPPAPWTFRPEFYQGAPRVCRSNHCSEVKVDGVVVGVFDPYLHLYSHHGRTEYSCLAKIDSRWFVLYEDAEWSLITSKGFWIEFVSESRKAVGRISRDKATRFGQSIRHSGRRVWAVPFEHYEVHRR